MIAKTKQPFRALIETSLHELKVRAPNVATQLRINDILSTYDNLIENNRRRMALLEELRLLYREWFRGCAFLAMNIRELLTEAPEGSGKLAEMCEEIHELVRLILIQAHPFV